MSELAGVPADYDDRVYAGVLGKLIGVYLGRPFEGWDHARITRELGPVTGYVHERFGVPLVVTDDDVAGTFTFVRALEEHGADPSLDAGRIGDTWLNNIVERRTILWWGGMGQSTEETAWRRLRAGTRAPRSGAIETNGRTVAEQIGAQIFIDGWAMVSPGRPAQAARLARAAARVSHDGEAVHAAVLLAVMEALAFVERDLDQLLDAGLAAIPADSLVARVARDVRSWCAAHDDWTAVRALIDEHHGYHRHPGHCHVIPNHAVVLMALLHGGDDFGRAMLIANTAGWDTDCNAGNVGCLTAIRLGLAAFEGGHDWRGPLADRSIVSAADGGDAITDAVRIADRLAVLGRRLAGVPSPPPPKEGARFHFARPGSVQGFAARAEGGSEARVGHDGGALVLRATGLGPGRRAVAATPCFMPADVALMRTYDLMASPTLHPGQVLRATLRQDAGARPVSARFALTVYGADDRSEPVDGPLVPLAPGGGDALLEWRVPDLGGRPVATVGIAVEGSDDATIRLDRLDWRGTPDVLLRRPDGPGTFWRRAWVDATSLSGVGPRAFGLAQDAGRGLLIYGSRDWSDLQVESELTIHLGAGGLAVAVQGLRRYVALLLVPPGRLRLLRVHDDAETILAEAPFAWNWDRPVRLALAARGGRLIGAVDGHTWIDREDAGSHDGAVALVAETGGLSADAVRITPSRRQG